MTHGLPEASLTQPGDNRSHSQGQIVFAVGLAIALVLRLSLSLFPYALGIDMNSFTAWSSTLAQTGITHFYSLTWCDYPPGYLYVLWFVGKAFQTIDPALIYTTGALFRALLKLPACLADLGSAWLIYQILKSLVAQSTARWAALLYAFNPFPLLISAVWGQVDGVIAFLMLCTIWLLQKGSFIPAALVGVLGVLVKPQGLFLAPAFIFSQWYRQPWWKWPLAIGSSLLLLWVGVTPFYWGERDFSSGLAILMNPFIFLYQRMIGTANGYAFASVNAFNLWGWANWQEDYLQILGISYKLWGLLLLGALIVWLSIFLYRQQQPQVLFLGVAIDLVGMFMLPTRMHERYILYAIPFLALMAAFYPIFRAFYWGFTLTGLANSIFVIVMYNHEHFFAAIPDSFRQIWLMSNMTINLGLFIGLIVCAVRLQPVASSSPDPLLL